MALLGKFLSNPPTPEELAEDVRSMLRREEPNWGMPSLATFSGGFGGTYNHSLSANLPNSTVTTGAANPMTHFNSPLK